MVIQRNVKIILQNSGWLVLDKFCKLIFGLFVGSLVARYLGPNDFGKFAYVLAYLNFFQALASLGLDAIVVREIASNLKNAGNILGSVFLMKFIVGILLWIIAILLMIFENGLSDNSVKLVAICGATLVFQSIDSIDLWFQSQSLSKLTVISKFIAYLISNLVKIVLILLGASLIYFAISFLIESAILAVALYFVYLKNPTGDNWIPRKRLMQSLLIESWPLILGGISIAIYMRIDQIMIKYYLGDAELGKYAAILTIATVWQFLPVTLMVSIAPHLARLKKVSEQSYIEGIKFIFSGFSFLAWMSCFVTFIFGNYFVLLLLGPNYLGNDNLLKIYALTNIFIFLGVAQGLWQTNEKRLKVTLYKTCMGALVSVGLNLVLIPTFGLIGAAISAVSAQAVAAVFSNILFEMKIFKYQLRSLILLDLNFKYLKYYD